MNILVVHEVSYRKKVVYEYQDFAERLAALGHAVTVLDYDDTGDCRYRKETLSRTGAGTVTLENTPYLNVPILKYLTGIWNYRKLLLGKLSRGEVDVVLLYSVFVSGVTTVRLSKRFGVPVVYRVLDIYHKLRQNRLIEVPLYLGEKYIYRHADRVCVTNEKLSDYIHTMVGPGRERPLDILHHGVDTRHFRPLEPSGELRAKYGLAEGDKVVLYLGTTYEFSGLDKLISYLPALNRDCGSVKLMVVGGGALDSTLAAAAAAPEVRGNVILTGFKGYEDLPGLLSLADVFVNPFALNEITRDIVPIKILQYLACGRATLSSPLPEVVRLFPEAGSGLCYAPVDPFGSFVVGLTALLKDDGLRQRLAEEGLGFVRANFSIDVQMGKLERMLTNARSTSNDSAMAVAGNEVTP